MQKSYNKLDIIVNIASIEVPSQANTTILLTQLTSHKMAG